MTYEDRWLFYFLQEKDVPDKIKIIAFVVKKLMMGLFLENINYVDVELKYKI